MTLRREPWRNGNGRQGFIAKVCDKGRPGRMDSRGSAVRMCGKAAPFRRSAPSFSLSGGCAPAASQNRSKRARSGRNGLPTYLGGVAAAGRTESKASLLERRSPWREPPSKRLRVKMHHDIHHRMRGQMMQLSHNQFRIEMLYLF